MPYIFGRLGFVAAPLLLAGYFLLCATLQQKVLDIACKYPEAHNMPSLAELVAGRFGRGAYQFLQIMNQQLFLPCALLFVIKSLKQIVLPVGGDGYVHPADAPGLLSCNVVWIFVILFVALVGANVQRRFAHAAGLCKMTCALNAMQVLLIMIRVLLNPRDPSRDIEPATAWLPAALTTNPGDRGYWVDVFTAVSSFGYCYVPIFIATEAMQELGIKRDINKSLWSSTGGMFFLYALVGVFPVVAWGWRREYEVLTELQGDLFGRSANLMLMLASGVDFLITAISLNQRFQEAIDPNFDPFNWSAKACGKWFIYSLPSLAVAFMLLCFVPDLNSLVGLMTAFVVPFSQIIGPATLTVLAARKGMLGRGLLCWEWFLVISGFAVGIVMLIAGGASTVYTIFFAGPLIKGDFFCDAVAG